VLHLQKAAHCTKTVSQVQVPGRTDAADDRLFYLFFAHHFFPSFYDSDFQNRRKNTATFSKIKLPKRKNKGRFRWQLLLLQLSAPNGPCRQRKVGDLHVYLPFLHLLAAPPHAGVAGGNRLSFFNLISR